MTPLLMAVLARLHLLMFAPWLLPSQRDEAHRRDDEREPENRAPQQQEQEP